jgi:tetratricopeptide (TPR) repeat protein
MRVRSFFGLLFAVAIAFGASYLAKINSSLLEERFHFGPEASVPVWVALLVVFLAGFLPVGATLVADTLRHELRQRRARREAREQESLDATYRRAVDLHADGQLARAATELEAYLAARPESFSGLTRYGVLLTDLGRYDEAIDVHRRTATIFPGSVAVLSRMADTHAARGESEVAREIQNRIVRESPGFGLEVLKRRRAEAISQRDWAEATQLHARIERLLADSGDAQALAHESALGQGLEYQRGVLMLEQDQVAEAAEIFRRLLGHEPRFLPARIMLGEAELVAERETEAVAIWKTGYLETGSPVFLQRIEDHFIEREKPLEAIETLRGLIAEADNDLLPRFYLGRLYHRLEMLDDAARTLAGIAERIKSSPTYHYLVGRIQQRRADLVHATESYLTCLRQLELGVSEYVCSVCSRRYEDWRDFCADCASWNSIDLNFEEERLSAEALGVQPVPVWGASEDSGEFLLAGSPSLPITPTPPSAPES